ncbi:MAG TPA: site-specific DNA-methyltransferase [Gemmatimonadaceae bacterium]|jgi:DNA modification methylase|nr:site-specific DNA-methyltransferase [Gemmatimonadaceae bacterium]
MSTCGDVTACDARAWIDRTHVGDCRQLLQRMSADGVRVQTCVTSPPYFGLRDYGIDGQIGLEETPDEYVEHLVQVFRTVWYVLADDGTLWLNLGDSYAGGGNYRGVNSAESLSEKQRSNRGAQGLSQALGARNHGCKSKDLLGIPWRVALALRADGWYLRSDIIWSKPNAMPESVTDRPTKSHEYLFLLAKSERYYYDADSIAETAVTADDRRPYAPGQVDARGSGHDRGGGEKRSVAQHKQTALGRDLRTSCLGTNEPFTKRNRRTVWTVPTEPFAGGHFAAFPRALIEPCIVAGSRPGDTVLDPFIGSGTTAQVATDLGRHFVGCELNPKYVALHEQRRTTTGMPI